MTTLSRFAAALSTEGQLSKAAVEVANAVRGTLGGRPSLAIVFASASYTGDELDSLPDLLCDVLGTEALIGTTAESIVGVNREVEQGPALSLWGAQFPEPGVEMLRLEFQRTPDGGTFAGWPDTREESLSEPATLLLLGDPYTFPADTLLERFNEDRPGLTVLGGMASGGMGPGENRIFRGRTVLSDGAVGALLPGSVKVRALVSQGCRPIGRAFVVTKAERNIVFELGGRPALEQLQQVFGELPTSDQALVQQGLHLGRVVNEYQDKFESGDFLIRNVTGFDPQRGALALGDFIRTGQTVQFHIRDEQTADQDLRQMVGQLSAESTAGMLLFSCNGRGTRMFSEAHHDAGVIHAALGNIPLAGMFAAGEIGPVGGRNFLHGFTASVAVFER